MRPRARSAAASASWPAHRARHLTAVAIVCALFAWVLWRTAWICDDAFITLRTIDNFVNGYGLRWNIAERVQSFTHPAWLILLTPVYAVTREPYFTTIAVQIALSLVVMFVIARHVALTPALAALAGAIFISSKALTDFSTSGLENPLTHAALVGAFLAFRKVLATGRGLPWMAGFVSIAILCRQDLVLLTAPALAYAGVVARAPRVRALALGLAPAAAWHLFALVYYGSLVPNTALAKLATGIPTGELVAQGWKYWKATLWIDPITVVVAGGAFLMIALWRRRAGVLMAAGAVLYALYLLRVGGDFMAGRFLTPLLVWVVLGAVGLPSGSPRVLHLGFNPEAVRFAIGLTIVAAGLLAPAPAPLLSSRAFGSETQDVLVEYFGVADERRFYYPSLGLQRHVGPGAPPAPNPWADTGRAVRARSADRQVIPAKNVGLFGYYAGPTVHVVDRHGLADPLLARLPAMRPWRIGHFEREVPAGYLETWREGSNRLSDPEIRALYEDVRLATQSPIWSAGRWRAVVRLEPLGFTAPRR